MKCPNCGHENIDESNFCQECGSELKVSPESSRCPYCAEKIQPGAAKCKHCGEWLNKKLKPQVKEEDYSLAITLGWLFTILGGVIGFIIALYLVTRQGNTRQDKRARDHGGLMIIIFIVWVCAWFLIVASLNSTYSPTYY